MKRWKAGIIGTGNATNISKAHLEGYRKCDNVEIVGVFNRSKKTAISWCETYGIDTALCYDSWEKLIDDVDIVSICTPNSSHADYICACLERNTNVICEKPLSSTVEDIPRIRAALATSTVKSMINLNYRQIPGLQMIQKILASGACGQVYMIRHNMGGSRLANESIGLEWRFLRKASGSGALGDYGSHALDILCYLTGICPEDLSRISARKATFIPMRNNGGKMQRVENDDCVMLLAELPTGTLYNLTLSRVGCMESVLEITAARALIKFELGKPDRITIQQREDGGGYKPSETVIAKDVSAEWHNASAADVPYLACADSVAFFVKCVTENKTVETGLEYGISILKTLEKFDNLSLEN